MRRIAAILCALVGALLLPAASPLAAVPAIPTVPTTTSTTVQGHASGAVIGVARGSFAIEAPAGRMSVVNALIDSANLVTAGDFPYVYGGGHAQAGIASIGIKGPGYNGRRIGFDCSGSVAAVLAGAGVWQPTSGVPNDAGIITELLQQHLIARGAGRGATEVTLYDDPGVHIFMNVDGHFFGTSDGGGGANPAGGAGWLDDGAPDATSHVYKRYHLLLPVIEQQTTFERIFTFQTTGNASVTHGLELGSDVHVGYTQTPRGRMTAQGVS
ncbi:MAG TPA: hypothetical protein VMA77_10725 [Solirubrobacteraceae bacterium]|nr:hypothetical protein [Solirubrobacteraceae bacterium]